MTCPLRHARSARPDPINQLACAPSIKPAREHLATGRFVERSEDALFLGPPGTGKSHLAEATLSFAAIHQGHRVLYREAHVLLEEIAEATVDGISH